MPAAGGRSVSAMVTHRLALPRAARNLFTFVLKGSTSASGLRLLVNWVTHAGPLNGIVVLLRTSAAPANQRPAMIVLSGQVHSGGLMHSRDGFGVALRKRYKDRRTLPLRPPGAVAGRSGASSRTGRPVRLS